MTLRVLTEYNHKNCFSADKLLFPKNSNKKNIINTRNNNISNITYSFFNNVFSKPTTLEKYIANKITYNRILKNLNSSNLPISITKSKIQNNFNSLSSYNNSKKNTQCNKYPNSLKKIISQLKRNYEYSKRNNINISKHNKYNSFVRNSLPDLNYNSLTVKHSANKPMINFDKGRYLIGNRDSILFKKYFNKPLKELLFGRKKINNVSNNNIKTIKQFDNRVLNEKRSSNKEFKSFINELQKNLEKSKSKSKPKAKFDY